MIGHTYRCENIFVVTFSLCIPKPHKHEEKANRLPMPTAVPIQSPSICISHLVVAGLGWLHDSAWPVGVTMIGSLKSRRDSPRINKF